MPSFNTDNIPEALKVRDRWVCWSLEERDGVGTKVPKRYDTGGNAKSTGPSTWTSFDNAVGACDRFGFTGVGFVLAEDRAFTGLDLDHVLEEDGTLKEAYRWIVREADTYTEVSPSGDGLHLFFAGGKPEGANHCRHGQEDGCTVEMYDKGRFLTVTGNLFSDEDGVVRTEVRENAQLLKRVHDEFLVSKKKPKENKKPARDQGGGFVPFDDEELVKRMLGSVSGRQIESLLRGDTSEYGGDDSAADMALCNHLAFWTAGDAAQMDRIFRTSGLMRDKWDERHGGQTYGQMTIDRAVSDATDFYKPAIQRNGGAALGERHRAPSVDAWVVDGKGLLWRMLANDESKLVTSTPPYLAANLHDVDTGTTRALVGVSIGGAERECALDRDTLLSNTKIVSALAPLGANISTSNARDVVSYLTLCDGAFSSERPSFDSVARMGWAKEALGPFMPFDAGVADVRFDPAPDTANKAKPFLAPKGTLAEWVVGIEPARRSSVAFRAVINASFASPLVALLGVQVFVVYLWGMSGSGKTPTLKAAGSVWGDPTEGADSYYGTFADTPKSIVRKAAFLGDFPILLDELQSKGAVGGQQGKRQAVEDLLYMLSLGHERGALNSNRTMMSWGSWRGLTIATGEIPILTDNTQQGAMNRTLEINAEPFTSKRDAQSMHHLVALQHGTAGRAFVGALKSNDAAFLVSEWEKMRASVCAMASDNPQAENIALLAFADALAEFYVFRASSVSWDEVCADAKAFARELAKMTKTSDERDTDRKAIAFVAEWLVANSQRFLSDSDPFGPLERYGVRETKGDNVIWYVLGTVFNHAMAAEGFDRDKTLRRMRDEGIIQTSGRSLMKQKRMTGGKPYCVCIDQDALESFLDVPSGQMQIDLGDGKQKVSQPWQAA